ncbi:uncharacterized protein [Linepithema humile]|uniref:uncharacterized protein n=1 Tax=Linepithema humile TaxID=83485 RepID=UPI00351DE956
MAVLGLCLSVLFVSVIVSTPIVHGQSLRRHHGHHSHPNYYDFEESVSRDLSGRLENDLVYGDSYRRKSDSHGYPRFLNRLRNYEPLRRQNDLRRYDDNGHEASSTRLFARRKRHNKHNVNTNYKVPTDEIKRDMIEDQIRNHENARGLHEVSYEVEVRKAQNSTTCSYTVEYIPIPANRRTRVPKNLQHVRCNHAGRSCQGADHYRCIQTYSNIEVSYGDGYRETIKIYVGCVCADYVLLKESPWPIDN